MTEITRSMTIAEVIEQKGSAAGVKMDKAFCVEKGTCSCCPETSHTLGFAYQLREHKSEYGNLDELIKVLNEMPDVERQPRKEPATA